MGAVPEDDESEPVRMAQATAEAEQSKRLRQQFDAGKWVSG